MQRTAGRSAFQLPMTSTFNLQRPSPAVTDLVSRYAIHYPCLHMTTELRLLAASVILGLCHLIADSHLISHQLGYRWTASSREQPAPALRGLASRVDQAYT